MSRPTKEEGALIQKRNELIMSCLKSGLSQTETAGIFRLPKNTVNSVSLSIDKEFGNLIPCPICQDEHVHFGKPEYVDGKDNYEAWAGRGDAIKIPLICENEGHKSNLIIGFHKGNSFLKYGS